MHRTARHADPAVNELYKERRKLATQADGSGLSAMRAWARLEALEGRLRTLAPSGEWRHESRDIGGTGRWQVKLPD